jgi:NAD(P)-dependent dehydrogenase (short-subunit alcohol dehydrogenase family)
MDARHAALVTGASSGIGFAIAGMLVEEGLAVTAVARDASRLARAAEELRECGGEVLAVSADVADAAAMKDAVAQHRARFGRLDVLVNNAGTLAMAPLEAIDDEQLERQLDVNLRAVILMYRLCRELLLEAASEHGNAIVVNTASSAGKVAESGQSVYSAMKHAVVGFSQAMNKELARHGVKSCAVCPAFVDTPMTAFAKGEVSGSDMIQPSDVAEMVRPLLRLSPACVVPELVIDRRANV